jgi:signal transduction histidine kinase
MRDCIIDLRLIFLQLSLLTWALPTTAQVTLPLRGVVTDVSTKENEFSLQLEGQGVSVALEGNLVAPALGNLVEVLGTEEAEIRMDRQRRRIKANRVTVLSEGVLPDPKVVSVNEVEEFEHLDQWISVEGTVLQVRLSMTLLTIQMVAEGSICNVVVRDWPRDKYPRDWIGGKVRVIGVNKPYLPSSGFLSMVVPTPAQVSVLQTGVSDPHIIAQGTDERVKLTGTLLGATGGNVFYARKPDGSAFSFYMIHPLDDDKSGKFSTVIMNPDCKAGDVVEVVGIPREGGHGLHLNFGVVKILRKEPTPEAIRANIDQVIKGAHVHDLADLEGVLTSLDDVMITPGRWRSTMRLEDQGHSIIAYMDSGARGTLAHLKTGHRFRFRGVVTGEPHFPEIRLWVRSPEDIQNLGIAKEVLTQRLWTGLIIAGASILLLAAWSVALLRSRKAVNEINATLEERVTERTAALATAKDELTKALSKERELSELKSRFVTLVSHEFRTPLGVTMSAVEVLRHYQEKLSKEKQNELLEDIHSATLQMSGLMEQVLLLGKSDGGKLLCRRMKVNLPELCQKIVDTACSGAQQKCPVAFNVSGDFHQSQMDPSLLMHILNNLLTNAIKYSAIGSPVELNLKRSGNCAVFTVRDRGIGIPEAAKSNLFEAFYRAPNVGEIPGTGLGLLLVKRCVELHGGTLNYESKEGEGSVFTITLPFQ